jgi:small subunit ribosomal protein S9
MSLARNMPKKKVKKQNWTYAVGRRRSASSRVRLFKGKGESTVNGKPIDKYFPGKILQNAYTKPFKATETTDKFYVTAKVDGGGKMGQVDAVVLAIAKALVKIDESKYKRPLRKLGLL